MQARAVFEAAAEVQATGIKVRPEIMIPLVGFPKELELQIDLVHRVATQVQKERNTKLSYLVGTMIEIPRACVVADEIAKSAQFFSFGTNDLTQDNPRNEPGTMQGHSFPDTKRRKSSVKIPLQYWIKGVWANSWKPQSNWVVQPEKTLSWASAANTGENQIP